MAATATGATAAASTLTPALFKRLHPRPYLDKFIGEGVRPDGRPVGAQAKDQAVWRDASINIGSVSTAPSSALVRLGKTTLVCGVTLEIAPPDLATPNQGFIGVSPDLFPLSSFSYATDSRERTVPNVDLSPLCSPLFRPGPPPDEAQVLSARLRDVLLSYALHSLPLFTFHLASNSSNVVSLSSLIIEPGKAAFVVYLDVVCLNYDGGVLDAAVLACVGALKSLVLPKATFDIDTNATICERPSPANDSGSRIPLGSEPYSVSFGVFNGQLLPDPTLFESQLCSSQVTVVVASPSSSSPSSLKAAPLLGVYQAGAPLEGGRETLRQCVAMARTRAEELRGMVAQ
ncbi:SPOSA6832_00820 [Sporobolomyces salmonicolor]|uniref:Ribosomal RNA-processing protein 43 n=1 Tax=Sporidiobolus salmonicolor TaxID=5005 RepID=A0A0D6EHB9_SPOSA|nr:SPOSA6832_00820 [Sporobolomyces salmonicolor]